jgi:type I restriction enzyme R subunit
VADRLLRRFKQAQERLLPPGAKKDNKAAEDANSEINALVLFKADMGAYQRMYSFLSQIFDYGNSAIEKRFIFYRRLIPLLEFGREREGIDLSKVMLTHHSLKQMGQLLPIGGDDAPKLKGFEDAGSGSIHERKRRGSPRSSLR